MKKLGIAVNQIISEQKYICLINELNKLNKADIDIILFYNDFGNNRIEADFPLMQSVEMLDYDGILIATDLLSANILHSCVRATKKYFYVWNIDWFKNKKSISFNKNTYQNKEIDLICRSKDHYKLLTTVFKEPKHIIEEFNHEQIESIVHSETI